jgi:calcium-binding protein CML
MRSTSRHLLEFLKVNISVTVSIDAANHSLKVIEAARLTKFIKNDVQLFWRDETVLVEVVKVESIVKVVVFSDSSSISAVEIGEFFEINVTVPVLINLFHHAFCFTRCRFGSKTTSDEVKRMKERIDQNGNGYIDLKEFADFHCTHVGDAARKDDELHDAIDLYDLDKDGLISPKELHIVLNKLGEKYSLGDYLRMISNVDVDDDGNINFEEFKKMMAR